MFSILIEAADVIEGLKGIQDAAEHAPEVIAPQLATLMSQYAHVVTGHLAASMGSEGPYAFSTSEYAWYEARRGGEHDFAALAIEAFNIDSVADQIVKDW